MVIDIWIDGCMRGQILVSLFETVEFRVLDLSSDWIHFDYCRFDLHVLQQLQAQSNKVLCRIDTPTFCHHQHDYSYFEVLVSKVELILME
jgi:hypothetical protein